jgi:hypothetical protein
MTVKTVRGFPSLIPPPRARVTPSGGEYINVELTDEEAVEGFESIVPFCTGGRGDIKESEMIRPLTAE